MECITCNFGDPLQSGDREGHSHPQVCPHQQQTITDQQTADQHSLVPCRKKTLNTKPKLQATGAGERLDLFDFPQMNMHIYAWFNVRKQQS